MKGCLLMLIIVALCAPVLTSAEDRSSNDLNTMLRDASYIFNRFEEVSAGMGAQIDTNYPVQIRKTSKVALSSVLGNVETEKVALNALLDHTNGVSSADLLDVYTELVEVTSEVVSVSYEISDWGDQKLGIDLAQLGAKGNVLGAKLAVALRSQIAAQELQLTSCSRKIPSH